MNVALVKNKALVADVLLNWRIWEKAPLEIWVMLFRGLEVLVSDNHPHYDLNVKLLHSVSIVEKLLKIVLVS